MSAQIATLTTSTKQCKIISKTGKIAIANVYEGEFLLHDATTPTQLLKILDEVEQNPYQSIILSTIFNLQGTPLKTGERIGLTTKERPKSDAIPRTKKHLRNTNRQGYVLFDIDDGGTFDELVALFPELQGVGFVVVPSSSSFIFYEDGSIHTGAKGWHIYIHVLNMSDAERIADILWGRMWLQGRHGSIKISNGIHPAMREQGLWDKCVLGAPERIVFEAAPELPDGLTRNAKQHRRAFDGVVWDTEKVANLTEKEKKEIAEIIKQAKAEKEPERKKLVKAAKKKYIEESPMPKGEALRRWGMLEKDILPPDFILYTEAGKREAGSLNAGDDGLTMADPNEPELLNKARFFWNDGKKPLIHSFAHGEKNYSISEAIDAWELRLEQHVLLMNEAHAQVILGGKHRIVREYPKQPLAFIEQNQLEKIYQNEPLIKIGEKTVRDEPVDIYANLITAWAQNYKSRSYKNGVIFEPNAPEKAGYLNTWRGLAVEPIEAKKDAVKKRLEDLEKHIENVVCDGDPVLVKYFYDWNAYTFQNPEKPAGAVLVLVGEKGTGKSIIGHFLMKIWGAEVHAKHISSSHHLVGNFNGHLADVCFLFADEAFYAGDKAGENVLKSLITEPFLMVERKGIDAVAQKNCLKIFMCTNNEKAVPASRDERRFCVFNVSNVRNDSSYFDDLGAAIECPEVQAAFLDKMLKRDISNFRTGHIPESQGLKDQRYQSLCSIGKWLFECIKHGELRFKDEAVRTYWQTEISTARLYDSYEFYCSRMFLGKYDKADLTAFGLYLNNVGFQKRRTKKGGTVRYMRSRPDAIELFQKYAKVTIALDVIEDADAFGCTFEPILSDV